jgi:hypothetical protein
MAPKPRRGPAGAGALRAARPKAAAQIRKDGGHADARGEHGSEKYGRGLADIAEPVDAERAALLLRGGPSRDVADADREGRTGETERERDGDEGGIRGLVGHEPDRQGDHGHQDRKDGASAETVGEDAHRDSRERSEEYGNGDQEGGLVRIEVEGFAEAGREGADQAPRREADGERNRTQRDVTAVGHRLTLQSNRNSDCSRVHATMAVLWRASEFGG